MLTLVVLVGLFGTAAFLGYGIGRTTSSGTLRTPGARLTRDPNVDELEAVRILERDALFDYEVDG